MQIHLVCCWQCCRNLTVNYPDTTNNMVDEVGRCVPAHLAQYSCSPPRELGSATIRHSQFVCQANLELSLGNFQLVANVTDLSSFAFTSVAVV